MNGCVILVFILKLSTCALCEKIVSLLQDTNTGSQWCYQAFLPTLLSSTHTLVQAPKKGEQRGKLRKEAEPKERNPLYLNDIEAFLNSGLEFDR